MSHQPRKLLEIYFSISVQISFRNHGSDLGFCHWFAEIAHGQPQLLLTYQTITVSVENFEGVCHIIIKAVSPFNHHINELGEVNGAIRICVNVSKMIQIDFERKKLLLCKTLLDVTEN